MLLITRLVILLLAAKSANELVNVTSIRDKLAWQISPVWIT